MKKNINKYIKFITIISLFTQLNAMEEDNNKRELFANINNNSNKKPRTESENNTDTDNENNQHCALLELPAEMQILILFHKIKNIINNSSDIFNAISDVSKFIYNIFLTHRNFYYFKHDLFKYTESCLKDKFAKDKVYILLRDNNGRTALIYAAHNGYTDIVRLLLQNNANIDLQDNYGCTALIYAAHNGHTDIVRLLLQNNANANIQDNHGCTALIYAAHNGYTDIVRLLLQNNANTDIQDNHRCTALIYAAYNSHTNIVQLLL